VTSLNLSGGGTLGTWNSSGEPLQNQGRKTKGSKKNIGMDIRLGPGAERHEVPRGLKHIEYWLIGFGELYVF